MIGSMMSHVFSKNEQVIAGNQLDNNLFIIF